ncbi:MAG: sigma-70 family RNA polymerase sigma factor, partial [Pararhodobacter sp.]|nr:sigma-70 family RNA polymerase sigma factor [Pararhodobacter sp.]
MKPVTTPVRGAVRREYGNRGQAALAQDDENSRLVAQMLAIADRQDEAAFAALFAHFAPRIKGFLMKSGAQAAQAEDCVQDVMATVWRKAAMFDPTRANVSTWIFTIARNRRIDLLRRERRPEPEDLPWGPEPDR